MIKRKFHSSIVCAARRTVAIEVGEEPAKGTVRRTVDPERQQHLGEVIPGLAKNRRHLLEAHDGSALARSRPFLRVDPRRFDEDALDDEATSLDITLNFEASPGVSLIATLGGSVLINFTHQVAITGSSFIVTLPVGVFDDGDYTVTSGFNTPVGAPPAISVPDSTKTETGFTVNTVGGGDVDAGTTIDFHVQAR